MEAPRIPPLAGPAANNVLLDDETERFLVIHRQQTGCQRPKSQAWICVDLHAPIPQLPYSMDAVLAAGAPGSFERHAAACQADNHAHPVGEACLCIARNWKRHLAAAAVTLDQMLGHKGCNPTVGGRNPW